MKIAFHSNNGLCPFFTYGNTRFYIKDKRNKNGYIYYLVSTPLDSEVINFETHEEALDHVLSIKNIKNLYYNPTDKNFLYTTHFKFYRVKDKTLTIWETPNPLSGEFESYGECLEFAKEYVEKFIRQAEGEQIAIFS